MKITKEYLLSKGFELRGESEEDTFYHIQFVHRTNTICPNSLTGMFDDQGFELYGYGYVADQAKMDEILGAIEILAAKPLSQIIKKQTVHYGKLYVSMW